MRFDEFWSVIVKELSAPKMFTTLKQSKEFEAKYSGGLVIITTSNNYQWKIAREHFHNLWNKALKINENRRFMTVNYNQGNLRTSSYILTLMKNFAGQNIE